MTISEPMTMLTDYALAALSAWAAAALIKANGADRAARLWAGALVATAVAAIAGGTFHGFQSMMAPRVVSATWALTMIAVGAASFCFASAVALAVFAGRVRKAILAFFAVKLALYLAWLLRHTDFKYAIYDYAPTMVAVLVVEVYVWAARRDRAAAWIVPGIVISFAGAFIQTQEIGFHRNFNHNDLYHVIQMVGIYCFYRAGLHFSERRSLGK